MKRLDSGSLVYQDRCRLDGIREFACPPSSLILLHNPNMVYANDVVERHFVLDHLSNAEVVRDV